ncbi:MAG: lysophospholipid acyltransferase family protein [Cetobacterium sp.]|uniref:lysophospholipid acyltransferase family protein n=1 Tax=unclassified Cetobacterium TaxID=2630983 RepID=UPI00163BF1E3|nr:lysophospholipid acyltransferase family protein [Cetobacterium sp. 2A]MBC2855745.1 lysophospholipid acyltransferase family protein [Cetobacterium sp. 2A]
MIHKLQFIIFKIFNTTLQVFPEKSRFKFAEFLGGLSYKLIKKRRIIALANLKLAFPEKTEQEREAIALESFKIMSKAFLSTLWFEEYLNEQGKVKIEGFEIFESAYKKNKGVIVTTLHMGNMEASLKVAEDYHVVTVAKKQRNPYMDDFITKAREKMNITLLKKDKQTSRQLMEHIERNEIIALFSDHRDKGASVDFFGETTVAPTGAVSLALKHNIPLVLSYNVMNKDNSCTVHVVEEIELVRTNSPKEDVVFNTQLLIYKMEKIISEHPEQWMWFHDRWSLYKKLTKIKK